MRVIASCIRSLTAGLSSVGSAIKDVAWSTYSKLKVSIAQLSVNSTNIAAITTLCDEELASTYSKTFLEHAKVKQESSKQIKSDFEKLPPQEETITLLSKGVTSVSEMGYYTNPEYLAPDALIPKDGFARIYGKKERLAMVDTLLYGEPATLRSNIKGAMQLALNDIKAAESKLTTLQSSPASKEEIKAATENLNKATATLTDLKAKTEGYESWSSEQLSIYQRRVDITASLKAEDQNVARATEARTKLQSSPASKEEIKAATENLNKATATLTDLKAKTEGYESWSSEQLLTYKRSPEASTISKTAMQAVETATATLELLKNAVLASNSKAIKTAEAKLECAKENVGDLKDVETWSSDKLLAYQAIQNQKLNRISLKVNGNAIDITSEFKTPTEKLNIFKASIKELTGEEPSDRQVCEMISLLDENGSIAGMASGQNSVTGFALGRTGDADRDIIDITLSPKGSKLHFNYTSPKAYLNVITIPGANDEQTSVLLSKIPATGEDGNVTDMTIDRVLTNIPQFKASQKYTYTYTLSDKPGLKNNLALLDSRMACLPVTLIPSKIQNQFGVTLNNPPQAETASAIHQCVAAEEGEKLPPISSQFYYDLSRTDYALLSQERKRTPLYDRSIENESDDQIEIKKRTAVKTFVNFVGNKDQALAISTVANQQLAFPPLNELMDTSNGPLQLPNYGGGLPLGDSKQSYTFSKSLEGNVVLYCKVQQTPSIFMVAKDLQGIELDSKKSFATFDYALTFSFDKQNKMTITPSSIKYDCHLEEGVNGLG